MLTTVLVGSSNTFMFEGYMVTPRGYTNKYDASGEVLPGQRPGYSLVLPLGGRVMARVGRLAGAILAETEGRYFLIGNTKEPCDFRSEGFEQPAAIDALKQAYIRLSVTCGSVRRA
jgi:hypothetical protein